MLGVNRGMKGLMVLALALCLCSCASGPELTSIQTRLIGRNVAVYYVQPADDIAVHDVGLTKAVDVGEYVGVMYLFGGLVFTGFTAHTVAKDSNLGEDIDRHAAVFKSVHWQDRIRTAVFSAVQGSKLHISGGIHVLDSDPGYLGESDYAKRSTADSLVFLIPQAHTESTGDVMFVSIRIIIIPHGWTEDSNLIADEALEVSQDVAAVAVGKTWDEQKQLGHKVHAVTDEQYLGYWFSGEPAPIAGFMDAAIPAAQKQLNDYLDGLDAAPVELPQRRLEIK